MSLATIAYAAQEGDFSYRIANNGVSITGYLGAGGPVIVPETLAQLPVRRIEQNAFFRNRTITRVSIPGSVTNIALNAFYGCVRLTGLDVDPLNGLYSGVDGVLFDKARSLLIAFPSGITGSYVIPSGVTSIGPWAFGECAGLFSVTFPNTLNNIGAHAFENCGGLIGLAIPDSVTSIQASAFYNCYQLANITLPSNLVVLEVSVLQYCRALGRIVIPNGVRTINPYAFLYCTDLTNVVVPSSVTNIEMSAFSDCSALVGITIPEGVTSIKQSTFQNCSSLKSVRIPDGVKSVENLAFSGCSGLTNLIIPNDVTGIGSQAFSGCSSLSTFSVPNSVVSIGNYAFAGCAGITNIAIGSGVSFIGNPAFDGCVRLLRFEVDPMNSAYSSPGGVLLNKSQSSIYRYPPAKPGPYSIPSAVTSIGYSVFGDCSGLTHLLIHAGVTSIPDTAFRSCTGLLGIEVDPLNGQYSSVDGAFLNKARSVLIQYPPGKVGAYAVPDSLTNILGEAFTSCTGLTSIAISDNVTAIGSSAFWYCTGLTSISIPKKLTAIPWGAFWGCSGLTNVTIPDGLVSVDESVFRNCTKLRNITIPKSVTSIGRLAFVGAGLERIEVDAVNPVYSSVDGVLFNKAQSSLVQYPSARLGEYSVSGSVTSIGESAFEGATGLTDVTIPNSVITIGSSAFGRCTGLTHVVIPDSVTSLGSSAFSRCSNLLSVVIPASIGTVPLGAFANCAGLTNVTIENGISYIGDLAFYFCSRLPRIVIPATVTSLGSLAFGGCSRLTTAQFLGNRPGYLGDGTTFSSSYLVTVFYLPTTAGWDPTYQGRPTAPWLERAVYSEWIVSTGLTTEFAGAIGEENDPDNDGLTNREEWLAGTDPTQSSSKLEIDQISRPDDLVDLDKTPVGSGHHALYFRSVPGVYYGLERSDFIEGPWEVRGVRVAASTQTRFLELKPNSLAYYRVVAIP